MSGVVLLMNRVNGKYYLEIAIYSLGFDRGLNEDNVIESVDCSFPEKCQKHVGFTMIQEFQRK